MGIEDQHADVSEMPGGERAAVESSACAELESRVSALETEKSELQDRLLRYQAEFENFKRRSERDRSEFIQFAGMEMVREILPILDDFERALKMECADRNYTRGVEQIYQRLYDRLEKLGLEPIETSGKQFDPHLHQAVEMTQTEDAEDHAIIGEFQKGYHFKGKLLRPSMVKVAVRP